VVGWFAAQEKVPSVRSLLTPFTQYYHVSPFTTINNLDPDPPTPTVFPSPPLLLQSVCQGGSHT
jgi:hypothetical protein